MKCGFAKISGPPKVDCPLWDEFIITSYIGANINSTSNEMLNINAIMHYFYFFNALIYFLLHKKQWLITDFICWHINCNDI